MDYKKKYLKYKKKYIKLRGGSSQVIHLNETQEMKKLTLRYNNIMYEMRNRHEKEKYALESELCDLDEQKKQEARKNLNEKQTYEYTQSQKQYQQQYQHYQQAQYQQYQYQQEQCQPQLQAQQAHYQQQLQAQQAHYQQQLQAQHEQHQYELQTQETYYKQELHTQKKTTPKKSLLKEESSEEELVLLKKKHKNEIEKLNKHHEINIRQNIIELENKKHELEECKKNLKNLKEIASLHKWDTREDSFVEPYSIIRDIRSPFYSPSGPFLYRGELNKLEDEMTEYKHHEVIYSNYKDEDKDLDYTIPGRALSVKTILEKNVVAFLNSNGGRLFFGITDDLIVYGIPNINTLEHAEHIQIKMHDICENLIAHNITTDNKSLLDTTHFILFIWHNVYDSNEKRYVLEIQVSKGSNDYVYMTSKEKIHFRGPATTTTTELKNAKAKMDQRKGKIYDKTEFLMEEYEESKDDESVDDT